MDAATIAQCTARKLGSAPFGRLRPGLEPTGTSSTHALMLHDEEIPLTNFGLGTRRLTSLSIQDQAVAGGSIVVIDEIEHGLEPHRLAHVLRYLRQRAEAAEVQVILTTHSPITVETLQASDLSVVHCAAGTTVVKQVSAELDNVQGVLRSAPSALLSRRVMVGEGPTEVGFIRGLLRIWDQARNIAGQAISATLGVTVVNGRGSSQPVQRGLLFRQLGYPTVVLLDNDDRSIDDVVTDAEAKGLNVLRWAADWALEEEIAQCIDEEGLREFVGLAAELKSEDSVRDSVASRLKVATLSGLDPSSWASATGTPLGQVRDAIGAAAKGKRLTGAGKEESKGWFKREDAGELLAEIVSARWSQLSATDIEGVISQLSAFAYADDLVSATEDVTKDV
jgi:hypothetical protein